MRYLPLGLLVLTACAGSKSDDQTTDADSASAITSETEDQLSGVYNVETVTCGGQGVAISVTATVTFDDGSYLEEWTFPTGECEVSLTGTAEQADNSLTLKDVQTTCAAACETDGFCDPTPCSKDQTYQLTFDNDELLMSFTQQGDEHSCGPCGDGVEGSYLLKRTN